MDNIKDLSTSFDQKSHWSWEIDRTTAPGNDLICPCDTTGYLLSKLEIEYSWINSADWRHEQHMLRKPWLSQEVTGNVVLDHAWMFERKAYDGAAKRQIESWISANPMIGKLLLIKPLWGFSISLDYADREGNLFEVYHCEMYGGDFSAIDSARRYTTSLVTTTDWNSVAARMRAKMDQWADLSVNDQRKWKSNYVDGL